MTRAFRVGFRRFWDRIQPRTLRARIMILIGTVNLAILMLTTASLDAFVYRLESNAWRGRQLEAARNAAQTVAAFLQRDEDALRWLDLVGYDEVINQPETLRNVLDQYPAFQEIVVLDREGHTLADATRSQAVLGNLFTIPQSEWFRAARAGQQYYTRVQISAQDEPYLIFAMPLRSGGVTAARIKMDVLRQVVAEIRFGKGGSVFIINQAGQVNAHTDPNIVLANTSMEDSRELQAILQAPNHEWFGERWNFNHQRVVSVSTAVGQTGWTVITELPVGEAYAASRLINVVLPVGLFLLMLATTRVIRLVLAEIFLKSVDILRDGAARIGEGELGYRMQIPRQDELGEVMAVFNGMAARLEAQYLSLEQRTAELRESERRYRLIAENASDVIWLRDMNLRLIYVSPAEMRLRGYTPEEALQQTLDQTLTPTSVERAVNFYAVLLSQAETGPVEQWRNESRIMELEVMCKDGSTVWTEIRVSFLPGPDGKPDQILGVTRDITARRRVEQELRALNMRLEERVRLRTIELSDLNEELSLVNSELLRGIEERRRAEMLLQSSLHVKEVLLKEIHHRVKNNLQIISSLLNLQSRKVIDAHTLEVLNDSQQRVHSMALIHEKLYQSEDLAQVNFREYIQGLAPSLLRSYQHNQAPINLVVKVDNIPLPLEFAIPCGLIVNELVSNALKYAFPEERGGTLEIELHKSLEQVFILRVADNGVGLPADLDIQQSPSLGLQLVNSLVGQLEGTLEVDRRNGAAFIISFHESL